MLSKLIFGSAGLAFQVVEEAPKLVESGRAKVEPQLRQARFLGELTVTYGSFELKRRVSEFKRRFESTNDEATADDPAAHDQTPTMSAQSSAQDDQPLPTNGGVSVPDAADLPIGDYETIAASHIVKLLDGLSQDELAEVETYERATRARRTILGRIEQLNAEKTSPR